MSVPKGFKTIQKAKGCDKKNKSDEESGNDVSFFFLL